MIGIGPNVHPIGLDLAVDLSESGRKLGGPMVAL
jgi:hypothetical protein